MEALERALSARGLTVSWIPGKGRGLIAARDFSPGNVIISQEPFASSPSKFSSGSSCDRCFTSSNLRKCSGCRIVWYCGTGCQKLEWKLHRLECKAFAALSEDREKMLTPTVRLMAKLVLRRKLQNDLTFGFTSYYHLCFIVHLSHQDMSDLDEKQLILYAQMANLVKLVLPSLDIDLKEVAQNFSKISCNAHTICDSELRPLGTGLYPIISIINHSCIPNSVLVFEGQVAFVRALEPIKAGAEVMISYIETAATTNTRQDNLKQYFFTCSCPRCFKELKEDAILEGYRCKDKKCDGFLLHEVEKKSFTCQQCGLGRDENETTKVANEIEEMSKVVTAVLSAGNLSQASSLYKNFEQLQLNLLHPHSIKLLQTRETLLKVCMELNDWRRALQYCQLTIPVYQRVYQSNHPMVGLQYYTCGKLEWLLEKTEDALKSFTEAANILRITHGSTSPFMYELFSRLEEAQAEASYKRSALGERMITD
ncbi:Histone-lysine N-methyltransferase ASHR1 [Apostasia shenzhenica]|uniref:Histone-lysine N-methyltransferase ASHR1 n=1 Tax=Apostasia shenzhenica TaxID=1088818 RepID=A0A2I0ADB4_9ASPA|nr:Histone-lysine N-methyltransferase ASHR1 [Apostasia shenzhenica]